MTSSNKKSKVRRTDGRTKRVVESCTRDKKSKLYVHVFLIPVVTTTLRATLLLAAHLIPRRPKTFTHSHLQCQKNSSTLTTRTIRNYCKQVSETERLRESLVGRLTGGLIQLLGRKWCEFVNHGTELIR